MAVRAIRVLSMRLGLPDAGSEPVSSTQRRAFDLVSAGFGPGYNGQLSVVVDLSDAPDSHRAGEKIAISLDIGRAPVCTPVTNPHLVCSLLLETKTKKNTIQITYTM